MTGVDVDEDDGAEELDLAVVVCWPLRCDGAADIIDFLLSLFSGNISPDDTFAKYNGS